MSLPSYGCDISSPREFHYWFILGGTPVIGAATQGYSVTTRVQRRLNEYFSGTNRTAFPSRLTVDGRIGDATLSALFAAANQHNLADPAGGYRTIAERIAADRRARTISALTWRWALWLAFVRGNAEVPGGPRAFESVILGFAPAGRQLGGSVLPSWNVAPPSDATVARPDGRVVSWNVDTQPPPPPRDGLAGRAPRAGTLTESTTGREGSTPGATPAVTPGATPRTGTGAAIVPSPVDAGGSSSGFDSGPDIQGQRPDAGILGLSGTTWLLLGGGAAALYVLSQGRGRRSSSRGLVRYRRRSR